MASSMNQSRIAPSIQATNDQPFDYWEFVHCSQCMAFFLPNQGQGQPSIPFWLTECGHILCNSHLRPDRTCPTCNATEIMVTPLQKDLPEPMGGWFRPLPSILEDAVYTAKFQQDSMSRLVRFYQAKCHKQTLVLNRLREEHIAFKELKLSYEGLQHENAQLREHLHLEGSSMNTKRRRMEDSSTPVEPPINSRAPSAMDRFSNTSHSRTFSSPRREVATPIGPPRLTLPVEQPQPVAQPHYQQPRQTHQSTPGPSRPPSSRFQQFAYVPPSSHDQQPWPNHNPPSFDHQHHPSNNTSFYPSETRNQVNEAPPTSYSQRAMPPPPAPTPHRAQFRIDGGSSSAHQPQNFARQILDNNPRSSAMNPMSGMNVNRTPFSTPSMTSQHPYPPNQQSPFSHENANNPQQISSEDRPFRFIPPSPRGQLQPGPVQQGSKFRPSAAGVRSKPPVSGVMGNSISRAPSAASGSSSFVSGGGIQQRLGGGGTRQGVRK